MTTKEPISYVATLYNKALFVPALVEGLAVQQDYPRGQWVFIDDGSKDNTLEVLEASLKPHREAGVDILILSQENQGPAIALNNGFAQAKNRWVKPMDGDDRLCSGAAAALREIAEESESTVALAPLFGGYTVNQAKRPAPAKTAEQILNNRRPPVNTPTRLITRWYPNPSAILIRKDALERSGGCDPRVFIQDVSLLLRLSMTERFIISDAQSCEGPSDGPERLSSNRVQMLHDASAAYACLMEDFPDLDQSLKRYMYKVAAGRAWHWARRKLKRKSLVKDALVYATRRATLSKASAAKVRATLEVFSRESVIRPGQG